MSTIPYFLDGRPIDISLERPTVPVFFSYCASDRNSNGVSESARMYIICHYLEFIGANNI